MRRVTVADIMRETGLSRATVDRVLNGRARVHDRTRAVVEETVARLRARKHREAKPFAVLFPDLAAVRRCCHVSLAERAAPAAALDIERGAIQGVANAFTVAAHQDNGMSGFYFVNP